MLDGAWTILPSGRLPARKPKRRKPRKRARRKRQSPKAERNIMCHDMSKSVKTKMHPLAWMPMYTFMKIEKLETILDSSDAARTTPRESRVDAMPLPIGHRSSDGSKLDTNCAAASARHTDREQDICTRRDATRVTTVDTALSSRRPWLRARSKQQLSISSPGALRPTS